MQLDLLNAKDIMNLVAIMNWKVMKYSALSLYIQTIILENLKERYAIGLSG